MVKLSLQVGQKGRNRFTFGIAIQAQDITGRWFWDRLVNSDHDERRIVVEIALAEA